MVQTANCSDILVVEDDTDIRETLIGLLRLEGYNARGADEGQAAMTILQGMAPCLILLDLMMPIMDGWQFLALKAKNTNLAEIPVVVISALDEVSRPATGARHFLRKPIDFESLLAVVKQYCELEES